MIYLNPNSNLNSIMRIKNSALKTFFINNISFILIIFIKTEIPSSIFSMNSPDWLTQFCPSINLENKSNSSVNLNKIRKTNIFIVKTNEKKNKNKNQFQII